MAPRCQTVFINHILSGDAFLRATSGKVVAVMQIER